MYYVALGLWKRISYVLELQFCISSFQLDGSPAHQPQADLRTETEQMLRDLGIPGDYTHSHYKFF